MTRGPLTRLVLRFAVAYAVLGVLLVVCERPLNFAMVPLVKLGLSIGHPEVEVLSVAARGHRMTASVVVLRAHDAGLGRRVKASVAASADMMLVGPLLALSAIAAFRFRSSRERAAGVTLGSLFVLLLSAHDVASQMTFGIASKLGSLDRLAGFYSFFLDSGGRQLLALGAAGAAIYLAGLRGAVNQTGCVPA